MRKSFEQSVETAAIVRVFQAMKLGEQMTFKQLSEAARFPITSTTSAYQSARRIVERDHGVYIGSLRGVGCFRGKGDDMADSVEPMAKRMRGLAKRQLNRCDLAIANNLDENRYARMREMRSRASIIFSTTSAPIPASNRQRVDPAPEAPKRSNLDALRKKT